MVEITAPGMSEGQYNPKSKEWRESHCECRYQPTSTKAAGDTKPLVSVPGYCQEPARHPGRTKRREVEGAPGKPYAV